MCFEIQKGESVANAAFINAMNTFLQHVSHLLDFGTLTKSVYATALEGPNSFLEQQFLNLGYTGKKFDDVRLYNMSTEQRSTLTKNTYAEFQKNPLVGVGHFTAHVDRVIHQFLNKYHIGFVNDVKMEYSGLLSIGIACSIHEPLISDNKESERILFEKQIETLKSLGLELKNYEKRSGYFIVDNDNNRFILSWLLSTKRSAKCLKITSNSGRIDHISFELAAQDIGQFDVDMDTTPIEVTTELNADEIHKIRKNIAEIYSSLSFASQMPDMVQTCCYVAENCFAEICEIVGYEGSIFKKVEARYETERVLNGNIRNISQKIGENFPTDLAKSAYDTIRSNLMSWCVHKMHSTVRNVVIDQYGHVSAKIQWIQNNHDMMYYVDDDEEDLTELSFHEDNFHLTHWKDSDYFLTSCPENELAITNMIASIPCADIQSICVVPRSVNHKYTIDHINVDFGDIAALINLMC